MASLPINLIDLNFLVRDGLMKAEDAKRFQAGSSTDFDTVKRLKREGLHLCFEQNFNRMEAMVDTFTQSHKNIDDFAFFMALKDYFGGRMWTCWPDVAIRMREEGAMAHYRRILRDEINFHRFTQYVFFTQWLCLKAYANKNGIQIFGDMPIYVAEDSADCWANPNIFQLDRDRRPLKVAGVPPDYFSGRRCAEPASNGGSTVCARRASCTTWCASTTLSALPTIMPSAPARPTRAWASGKRRRDAASSSL